MRVSIKWDGGEVTGTLADTPTGRKLYAALPCEAQASTWGDEVYFPAPIDAALEDNAQQVVDAGAICYWVQGQSVALPYGPTPISVGQECRLVTAVNVCGRIDGEPRRLAGIREGDRVRMEAG